MSWQANITTSGLSMLDALLEGENTLIFTHAKTATGLDASLETLVDPVTDSEDESSLSSMVESDGVRLKVKIYAHEGETGYDMTQIGVYAKLNNDGEDTLFIVMQNSDGVQVPSKVSFRDFVFNISFFLETSKTAQITVTVDPDALVSNYDLQNAMSHVVNLYRQYYASKTSISLTMEENKTYIVWSANQGNISTSKYGSLFFISNKNIAEISSGDGIAHSVSGDTFTLTSTSSVPMGIIEV